MPHLNYELPKGVKTMAVNGYDMAFFECGKGVPLVLVHGSLSDYRSWALQMAPFGKTCRTVAVSLRHCFPEIWDGRGDGFSLGQHADDLSIFIQKLDAGPVHLLGHSRGGDVALLLAADHPGLVRSLVLADPAPLDDMLPGTPDVCTRIEKRRTFVTGAVERLLCGDRDGGLELFTDAVSVPGNWQKLPESARKIRRDNAWSLKSLVSDAQVKFNRRDAAKIEAPVLLMTGDKSPGLYGLMHDALQSCLKYQQKVTIPNASHGMMRDNPKAFNTAVMNFLEGHN